jgi:hypothetical protein
MNNQNRKQADGGCMTPVDIVAHIESAIDKAINETIQSTE